MGLFSGKADPNVSAIATMSKNFYGTLQAEQNMAWQGQQAALQTLSQAWAPVLKTGAIPYGFSPGLDSLLRTNAIDEATAGMTSTFNAAKQRMLQASGGANVMPTGAEAQIEASIGATGAQQLAKNLSAEKLAGYQTGLDVLKAGTQAELGIAGGEEAAQMAGQATAGGQLGLQAGQAEFQEQQSTGLLSKIGKVAGTIGSITGAVTGVGNMLGSFSSPAITGGTPQYEMGPPAKFPG